MASRRLEFSLFTLEETLWAPDSGAEVRPYVVLQMRPWINVIAITDKDETLLVKQFRFGIKSFTLELPAGSVNQDEHPREAASRELLEETGYVGDKPIALGSVHPNPAIQDNVCTTWLIRNARRKQEPMQDPHESLELVALPIRHIPRLIATGEVTHALTIAGFYLMNVHEART
jgi:ADP-ribose diphosphatase